MPPKKSITLTQAELRLMKVLWSRGESSVADVVSATADDGAEWVRSLVADLQIPGLKKYGLTPENTSALIPKAAQASSMKANPIVLTPEELAQILRLAL